MNNENQILFDELLSPLEEPVQEIESTRKKHHREVLGFPLFVRTLVYYFVFNLQSGRQLVASTKSVDSALSLSNIKKSTFFDAFNRFPVAWFAKLFGVILSSIVWREIPELALLGKLYVIDGSIFPAISKMCWAEYKAKCPAIKLHLCFELNRMLPVNFLMDTGNSSERDALRKMLEAGVTYIADRGYVCFQLFQEIVEMQAHFVIRVNKNLKYEITETLTASIPDAFSRFFCNVTDQLVHLTNSTHDYTYRLVTFEVGSTRYLILTNRRDLSTFQIILLYAYRWQVELIFKFLKHSMNGLHLITNSSQGLTIQFYMILITALLQLRLKQLCIAKIESSKLIESSFDSLKSSAQPTATSSDNSKLLSSTTSSRGQTFMITIGEKLHQYWKVSSEWLLHLRNLLAKPFDMHTLQLLADT